MTAVSAGVHSGRRPHADLDELHGQPSTAVQPPADDVAPPAADLTVIVVHEPASRERHSLGSSHGSESSTRAARTLLIVAPDDFMAAYRTGRRPQ